MSVTLLSILEGMFQVMQSHSLHLMVQYLPGVQNVQVDALSHPSELLVVTDTSGVHPPDSLVQYSSGGPVHVTESQHPSLLFLKRLVRKIASNRDTFSMKWAQWTYIYLTFPFIRFAISWQSTPRKCF